MIAYYFPPGLEVGRIRTVKHCKYLPRFGWKPVVLTCEPETGMDPDPHHEIPPEAEVHRVPRDKFHPWLLGVAQSGRALAGRLRRMLRSRQSEASNRQDTPRRGLAKGSGLSALLRTVTYWPDHQSTWSLPAGRKALALARGCDALYSSGNPPSCHVVAMRVKKLTHLPWIMDFRDPWMISGGYGYPFVLQRKLFHRLEHRCISLADRVLQTTDPRTEMYREAYPDQPRDKFITMPNGYDPDDFEDLPTPEPRLPLTLTYLGSLTADRNATPLIQAIAKLKEQGQVDAKSLRVNLIGPGTLPYSDIVARRGVDDIIYLSRPIPYKDASQVLARSHIALLISGPKLEDIAIPTKFYEYFAMRKHILALVPEGHLAERLRSVGAACVGYQDSDRIARMILDILNVFREVKYLDPPDPLPEMNEYSREHLSGRLAGLLEDILAGNAGRQASGQ